MNVASVLLLLTILCKYLNSTVYRDRITDVSEYAVRRTYASCLQRAINSFNCVSNETLILCSGREQMCSHKYDGHVKTYMGFKH